LNRTTVSFNEYDCDLAKTLAAHYSEAWGKPVTVTEMVRNLMHREAERIGIRMSHEEVMRICGEVLANVENNRRNRFHQRQKNVTARQLAAAQ
jgi:hypothetical protein